MFNIFDLLHKLNEGIAAIENEFGVVVIIEGVYSEYPDGERHRIA
jgi:hypothetical protein